jgi:hypothetical protein
VIDTAPTGAVRYTGVRVTDLPLSPSRLVALLQERTDQ